MDGRPHALTLTCQAAEKGDLKAPCRRHRGGQSLPQRADAQRKAAGAGKAGEKAVRALCALVLALVCCMGACSSVAHGIVSSFDQLDPATHLTDFIAQFNRTAEVTRFCSKSECCRSWNVVVHAALVARTDSMPWPLRSLPTPA